MLFITIGHEGTPSTASMTSMSIPTDEALGGGGGLSKGALAGILVAVLVVVALVTVALLVLLYYCKRLLTRLTRSSRCVDNIVKSL